MYPASNSQHQKLTITAPVARLRACVCMDGGVSFSASMVSTIVSRSFLGLLEHSRKELIQQKLQLADPTHLSYSNSVSEPASFWDEDDDAEGQPAYPMRPTTPKMGRGAPSPVDGKTVIESCSMENGI